MTMEELEQQLMNAEQLVKKAGGNMEAFDQAHEALASAQRALAAARGEEYAIPYETDLRPPPSGGALEIVLQSERATVLVFYADRRMPDGYYAPAGWAVVDFDYCRITKFGYPNDEALPGHPIYAKGLRGYGVYEVMNSSWIRQIDAMNRVCFPNHRRTEGARHFILNFHDDTIECIGYGMRIALSDEPYEKILAGALRRVLGDAAYKDLCDPAL